MKLSLGILLLITAVPFFSGSVAAQNRTNGKIAFNETQPFGDSQIYLANADGSGITQVPSPTACLRNEKPKWSPDGKKLVFASNCDGNGLQIYSENFDGTSRVRLTSNSGFFDDSPTWSPDGRTIAFVSTRDFGQFHIYLMNADGTNQRRLTNSVGLGETNPNWSPDGSRIVYVRQPSTASSDVDVFVINADGSNPVDLTNNPNPDREPAWSPDGSKIVFTSLRNQANNIYVMNADGTNQVKLDSLPGDGSPSWSPDGTKIIFNSLQNGNNADVYVMNPDGTGLVKLIGTGLHDQFSAWQPMLAPSFSPTLITASGSNRAIALDSVTFRRDPFTINSSDNFSSDQRTRIMLLAVYADLLPGEDFTAVTAQAETSQHQIVPLTVEYVGKNPVWVWLTQINVKLTDQLSGDLLISITLHGTTSNKVLVTIQ